jgi:hypothetical protein
VPTAACAIGPRRVNCLRAVFEPELEKRSGIDDAARDGKRL